MNKRRVIKKKKGITGGFGTRSPKPNLKSKDRTKSRRKSPTDMKQPPPPPWEM